jgi:head-tail adaptor
VRIRYWDGITDAMRVVHGTDTLGITTVLPDARRRHVDLVCESTP